MNDVERLKGEKDGLDVWADILRYAETGFESIDPDDFTRMRWYGLYQQRPNVGHFMLRVRVPGGELSAAQVRVFGEISKRFGGNIADITTRQTFQFHWLTVESFPEVFRLLHGVGLSSAGACGDILRNITGCPVAGIDPDEVFDARPYVDEINRFFLGNHEFSNLPRKYKTSIAGCCIQCAQPEINDIGASGVKRRRGDGTEEIGFHVRVGGGLSARPFFAKPLNMFVPPEKLLSLFIAVTTIFRDFGNRENRKKARLKFLVDEWGIERFEAEVRSRLDWKPEPAVEWPEPKKMFRDHIGVHSQKQEGLNWIGVCVLTGRLSGDQILEMAQIAEEFGSGSIRTTNQQNFIVPNVPTAKVDAALEALGAAGFVMNPSSIRRASVACTGNEFCNLALTETKLLMREIVEHLDATVVLDELLRINLNGCPNSCGQHHIGQIGLQGCLVKQPGGGAIDGYDISLGGRLGGDSRFVRPIWRKVPAHNLKFAIEHLLHGYLDRREPDEDFSDFVDRTSDEELAAMMKTAFAEEA
jgi:sulfite reductase beta subunit-like hemoprotein